MLDGSNTTGIYSALALDDFYSCFVLNRINTIKGNFSELDDA